MLDIHQINLIRRCNLPERRSLEEQRLASPVEKQGHHPTFTLQKRHRLHQSVDDDGRSEQKLSPFCSSYVFSHGLSSCQWYEYKPLPSFRSIRLLEIQHRSTLHNALRCRMRTASIGCLPQYYALSYAWGTAKETENLECDGKFVKIRRNLMHALQRLQHTDNVRWLWVDAICINQQDKEEKDKQIPLMRDIYQMAQRVVVWIGEDNRTEAKAAFDYIRQLSRYGTSTSDTLSHDAFQDLLSSFYRQRWFSRVWIIQEVAMAAVVEVLWGAEMVSWAHVCRATAIIRTFRYRVTWHMHDREVDNAYLLSQLPDMDDLSLLYWLEVSRRFDSTKVQDRVYSLLGLTNSSGARDHSSMIRPNHRMKTRALFKQVAMVSMRQLQTSDVLAAVQHDNIKSYRPTWVPRWNFSYSLTIAQLDPRLQGFSADKRLPPPRFKWTGKYGQVLCVNGVAIDRVVETSDNISATDSISEQITKLVNTLEKFLTSSHPYPTSEDLCHVCCWTVTAGKDHYGTLVTDAEGHLADFREFWSCRKLVTTEAYGRRQVGEHAQVDRFIHAALASCRGRRLFRTAKGYFGLGSAALRPRDTISLLCGGTVPMALRTANHKIRTRRQYLFVGEAYIHGIMHGEAADACIAEKISLASFEII